jgi:hypothetical protein
VDRSWNIESCRPQSRIIISAEVVESDNPLTRTRQPSRDVKPDKTGGARHRPICIQHLPHQAAVSKPAILAGQPRNNEIRSASPLRVSRCCADPQ